MENIIPLDTFPLEIIIKIIEHVEFWKDVRIFKQVCKRICNIILVNKKVLFEKRLISNDFVKYDEHYQIKQNGLLIEIKKNLPFYQLPWCYHTRERILAALEMFTKELVLRHVNKKLISEDLLEEINNYQQVPGSEALRYIRGVTHFYIGDVMGNITAIQ